MFSLAAKLPRTDRTTSRRPHRGGFEPLEARQVLSASIGGAVWLDANSDGVRDASETASVDGFTVLLYTASGLASGPVASTPISGGQYSIGGLPAGDYVISLGDALLRDNAAYRYSPLNRTSDEALDNDVNPATGFTSVVTLSDGQSATNVDVGVWQPGRIEGSATYVGTINGVQEMIPLGGIKFTLHTAAGNEYAEFTTKETGLYTFAEVPQGDYYLRVEPLGNATVASSMGGVLFDAQTLRTPTFHLGGETVESHVHISTDAPLSVGGRLWHDLNANGSQDPGEPGIAGRQVGIVTSAREGWYNYGPRVTTDAEGNYRFDGLPPARYQLGLTTFSYSPYVVNNEALSAPRQSNVDASLDSDFQPTSGVTPAFVVEAGANLLDFDGGLFYRASIRGVVFDDADGDGIRSGGEALTPATEVRLLREDGTLVTAVRTQADGTYVFADLLPRAYIVEIARPDGTTVTAGANPVTGRTAAFALASNAIVTRDFGLRGTTAATAVAGSAWNDANGNGVRESGEQPLAGVGVQLLTPEGAFVGAATTDAAGNYTIANVAPGGYLLRFTPPAGTLSPMNQGGDDLADSDVNRGSGLTAPLPIFAGQTDSSQDVGVYLGPLSTDVKANLRVTEVGFVGHSNSEFVEVRNVGAEPIDLAGVQFTKGIRYDFSMGLTSLFPGEYGVIVGDYELLSGRTDVTQINVLGLYSGDINRQERLTLIDGLGQTVLSFEYDDDWFVLMDRETMPWTLSVIDDTIAPELWEQRSTWRPSSNLAGSPGRPDPGTTPNPGAILINEVLTKSDDGFNDLIELRNTTNADIDIGGWYLGDSNSEISPLIYLTRYRIPGGTVVPANGYLVLSRESDFGVFGLSSFGETLHLVAGDEYGAMAGYAESVTFGGTEVGVSFGRYENVAGVVDMLPQQTTTFGAENSGPRVGPVVISEIMYNQASGVEFVELVNTSATPVDLGQPGFEWRLAGAVQFTFAQGTVLPAGGRAVVTSISPSEFRLQHNLGLEVIVAGPWFGDLPNGGGEIELVRNDDEIKREDGRNQRKEFLVDRVNYDDTAPWPTAADGGGASLERISPNVYGNQISNWMASQTPGGTPGSANTTPLPGDCDGDGTVTPADIDALTFALSAGTYDAHFDLDGSGTLDASDRTYLVTTLIGASFGDANLDGRMGLTDVFTVRQNLGSPGGWGDGDFTGDGMVTVADLSMLVRNFGGGSLAASASSALVVSGGGAIAPRQSIAATRDTRREDTAGAASASDAGSAVVAARAARSASRRVARSAAPNAVDSAIGLAANDGAQTLRTARVARALRR
ncbi:MAG: hypothetical protein DCC68_15405 [Planctomycetota bacterium]|nr:MAG: hypothetical protein DCC68_15405 [Planctomycetota bacterium]